MRRGFVLPRNRTPAGPVKHDQQLAPGLRFRKVLSVKQFKRDRQTQCGADRRVRRFPGLSRNRLGQCFGGYRLFGCCQGSAPRRAFCWFFNRLRRRPSGQAKCSTSNQQVAALQRCRCAERAWHGGHSHDGKYLVTKFSAIPAGRPVGSSAGQTSGLAP